MLILGSAKAEPEIGAIANANVAANAACLSCIVSIPAASAPCFAYLIPCAARRVQNVHATAHNERIRLLWFFRSVAAVRVGLCCGSVAAWLYSPVIASLRGGLGDHASAPVVSNAA